MNIRDAELKVTSTLLSVVSVALGCMLVLTWQTASESSRQGAEITQLKADLRAKTARIYTMQEDEGDKLDAARGEGFQDAFNQCKQGVFK